MNLSLFSLPGLAQASTATPQPPQLFDSSTWMILAVVGIAFYFMILRPQNKERQERDNAMNELKKGDRVLIGAGIHGTVHEVRKDDGILVVEIDKGVKITVNRGAITPMSIAMKNAPAKPAEASDEATAGKPAAAKK